MEKKKISSNFPREIAIEKINFFLEKLLKMSLFDHIQHEWETPSCLFIKYTLKRRQEQDSVKIIIVNSTGIKAIIYIQSDKRFTTEYFLMELEKVL